MSKKKPEYWSIPPNRCKYSCRFEREVETGGYKGTKFECICFLNCVETDTVFYKCCEENCPEMDSIEKIMFKKKDKK